MQDDKCPVCGLILKDRGADQDAGNIRQYLCKRCGGFILHRSTEHKIKSACEQNNRIRAALSHAIRKMQKLNQWPLVSREVVSQIVDNPRLPSAFEQADNLILWLGDNIESAGSKTEVDPEMHGGIVGALNNDNFHFVVNSLIGQSLVSGSRGTLKRLVTLSFKGWERYALIKKGEVSSRKAFMAMPFSDHVLDEVLMNCFKPAVERTGFELLRLDEVPKAGLIDDRLRVEILTSKFLIAELTNGNQGVYWEAGFAEGLGKPVIYTCERSYFKVESTHFDANHHLTVLWDKDDLEKAGNDLAATIRATLPEDAKLSDK